ncbi:NADP-dependent oxidoreductase [Chitinophaga filiformis]|uniref:NADP-dependent oxidoreductase n=1 Tax=Chitinophaga filiformis TaxID=104663 RepID=A0ABY4I3V3_CHIFI|nr:NADP-dependent oxidoreductase [Chitinophaga filiformis]UPK69959.1 NADP-dependent oxidoreductase [Chitinophaga filiformis]
MKAILLNEAGGTDKLIYQDIEKPQISSGHILVKIKAIGLNPMDVYIRSNEQMIDHFLGTERPVILGWDIAGDIVEKADDVIDFEKGDAVFGITMGKAYAEYVAVNASMMANKPENISYQEAAGIPVAGVTAWEALVKSGNIKKGDRVLIHAGSGGVGHIAIQLAKHFGATVIATSSAKNRDFVLSLGADQHIDYTSEKFNELLRDVDLVLDTIGGETREQSIDVVKQGGTIVSIVPPLPDALEQKARSKGVNLELLIAQGDKAELGSLATLLNKGGVKVHVSAVYPFTDMARAHQAIETKRTIGKIVVDL